MLPESVSVFIQKKKQPSSYRTIIVLVILKIEAKTIKKICAHNYVMREGGSN